MTLRLKLCSSTFFVYFDYNIYVLVKNICENYQKKNKSKNNLNVIKTVLNFKTKLQKKVLGPNKNNTGRQLLTNY